MTSPSPANIAYNGNITTWWIPATNLSALTATGVVSTLTIDPANGLKVITWETANGTFNKTTGVWTIGTLAPGTTVWLKLVTQVIDIGLAPFELTYVLSGSNIDPNNVNNEGSQTLTSVVGAATAAAIDDPNSCNCVDVSLNDTACNVGVTEWRLNVPSLTNVASYTWDVTTGKGKFIPTSPFVDSTFTYTIWCDTGSGFVQTSGPALVTITAMFDSVAPWNHSSDVVEYSELSVEDIAYIETIPKYTAITIADYCWRTLRNADGTLVSAEAVECTGQQDTRHFYFCSENECDPTPPTCTSCPNNQLPADAIAYLATIDNYVPEIGDTIKVQFTDAYSYYTYETLGWTRSSCSCVYKISQDAGNLLTLGTDNAPYISESIIVDAVDEKSKVTENDTTSGFLNDKLIAGTGISFTVTNPGANEGLVIATSAAPSTNVQVADTSSINMGLTGTGTVPDPFIISGAYNDGSPTPVYDSGTPGSTGNTLNVTTLFGMPCAGAYTATYTLNGYSTEVYENVTLVGTTLTYDIKLATPSGTHYINIQRICA